MYSKNYKQSARYLENLKKTSRIFKNGQNVQVRGTFKTCRYQGDNDFVITTMEVNEATDMNSHTLLLPEGSSKEDLVCKGTVMGYADYAPFILEGEIVDDKTYGIQLNVKHAAPRVPSTSEDLVMFLKSLNAHMIGQATAQKIVDALGDDAYDVIVHHPEKLNDIHVPRVSSKNMTALAELIPQKIAYLEVSAFLGKLGISVATSAKIIAQYGADTITKLKENPYILTLLPGFAFTRADNIARKNFKVELDDPRRLDAGIIATLRWTCDSYGHTLMSKADLYDAAYQKLGIENYDEANVLLQEATKRCIKAGTISELPDGRVQLLVLAQSESTIKNSIQTLLNTRRLTSDENVSKAITKCEPLMGMKLTDEQLSVTHQAFQNGITLLTASAGAGKSTAIKMVVQVAEQMGINYVLCSPTGKAAKRLREACTVQGRKEPLAFTLHRALGLGVKREATDDMYHDMNIGPGSAIETFDRARLVICDEASMLDTQLASMLFKNCANGKHLLLIGDPNQLPSVGPGAVLYDMLNCPDIPQVRLHHIFRQAAHSPVLVAANDVLAGKNPCKVPGISFYECEDQDVLKVIDEHVMPIIKNEKLGVQDIAFMSPMKKRTAFSGTEGLNAYLRPLLNPYYHETSTPWLFQKGDFVTQVKNDYKVNHFNGDQGIVVETNSKEVIVSFYDSDDEEIIYAPEEAKQELMLAYASTIHRYQGSQCDTVVLVMTNSHYIMCNRNLLYTGITRAAKRLILIGNEQAFKRAAKNVKETHRDTGLQDMRFAVQERMQF